MWTEQDSVGTPAELLAQVQSQVRPATNEETEEIDTVASLLPELTEAVREGRTRHFADSTDEGDPEDEEEAIVEGDTMDIRIGRRDSQREPEVNANLDATSRSNRSETHAEPEAEVSTSIGTDMEIEASERTVRFQEEKRTPKL